MSKRVAVVCVALLSLLIGLSGLTLAAEENRVAVVVSFGGGNVTSHCVSFTEPEISGFDALQRSGLSLLVDDQAAGSAVCSIDGTGCPPGDCFCQCRGGGNCVYWSYWHWLNDAWAYSAGGSSVYRVRDGDIEGWAWGPGSVTEAVPPPVVRFEDVCLSDEPATATVTPSVTPTRLILASPVPATETPGATATSGPTTAATVATSAPMTATPQPTTGPGTEAAVSPTSLASTSTAGSPQDRDLVVATSTPSLEAALPTRDLSGAAPTGSPPSAPPETTPGSAYPAPVDAGGGAPSIVIQPLATLPAGLLPTEPVGSGGDQPATAVAAVTVIGAGVAPQAPPTTGEPDAVPAAASRNWLPYVALPVMLLGLGALVAVARGRRTDT
jgi:hypothetical protein